MKFPIRTFRWVAFAVVGVAVGVATAFWATSLDANGIRSVQGYPEWRQSPLTGSSKASPYTRALVARYGLLALNQTETVYYSANTDHANRTLLTACDYELAGRDLPSQWWSFTLYASDSFLPRNGDHAYSVGSRDVVKNTDGSWTIRVAQTRDGAANWLSTRNAGRNFFLSIRLYQPAPSVLAGKVPDLPIIRRVSCPTGGKG